MKNQFKNLIPENKIDVIENALKETFKNKNLDNIELVTGGLSDALVYKISINDKSYLLKISIKKDMLKDPKRYFICNKYASEKKIAPYLYYSNDEEGVSISDFIYSKKNELEYNDLLITLSNTVKSIHKLPLFPKLVNFIDGIDIFIDNFKKSKLFPEESTKEHFELYSKIQEFYPRNDLDLVSSHNDLNRNNILFDVEKIWIIDWEASFLNDRYVDLAIIGNLYITNLEQEEIYLTNYFDKSPNEYQKSRFFIMQQVINFYYSMILLNMIANTKKKDESIDTSMDKIDKLLFFKKLMSGEISMTQTKTQLIYSKILLQNALENMKTERFLYSINILKDLKINY